MAGFAARAQARIKQLCCLGLGGEAIMPALLRELHHLIPSYANTFFWADENGRLSNICDESPDSAEIGPLYVNEFYNRRECEVQPGFSYTMRHHHGVYSADSLTSVSRKKFLASDLYNLVFRPLKYHDFVRLMVREGGHTLGALQLWRAPGEARFTRRDRERLRHLGPYIAHALTEAGHPEVPLVESDESGLLIADRHGCLQYACVQGRKLLFLATHPGITPGRDGRQPVTLPPVVMRLCNTLIGVFESKNPPAAPVCEIRNTWGRFTFRAHRLENSAVSPAVVGITVCRWEPLPLKLMRQMDRLLLTARQAQTCLLMANGLSATLIAKRMHISEHTAIAHSRQIYAKLGVHNRSQMMSKLLVLSGGGHEAARAQPA